MRLRIGIDVGGTFTDFVALDRDSGRLFHHKEPSTPASPAEAVESGTGALLAIAGAGPGDVEMVVHGTTIALNAILQRRGAKVALVTSTGNRDLLEIARRPLVRGIEEEDHGDGARGVARVDHDVELTGVEYV